MRSTDPPAHVPARPQAQFTAGVVEIEHLDVQLAGQQRRTIRPDAVVAAAGRQGAIGHQHLSESRRQPIASLDPRRNREIQRCFRDGNSPVGAVDIHGSINSLLANRGKSIHQLDVEERPRQRQIGRIEPRIGFKIAIALQANRRRLGRRRSVQRLRNVGNRWQVRQRIGGHGNALAECPRRTAGPGKQSQDQQNTAHADHDHILILAKPRAAFAASATSAPLAVWRPRAAARRTANTDDGRTSAAIARNRATPVFPRDGPAGTGRPFAARPPRLPPMSTDCPGSPGNSSHSPSSSAGPSASRQKRRLRQCSGARRRHGKRSTWSGRM